MHRRRVQFFVGLKRVSTAAERAVTAARVRRWRAQNSQVKIDRPQIQCKCDVAKVVEMLDGLDSSMTIRERFIEAMQHLCGTHLLVVLREILKLS